MTMAITVSRQIDVGSRVRYTYYWENLVLVVVLILESKALYFDLIRIVIVIYLRIFCRKWQRWRQVITNHVCQHGGKSWPYWFRKMGNWASLLLSAVLWDLVDRAIQWLNNWGQLKTVCGFTCSCCCFRKYYPAWPTYSSASSVTEWQFNCAIS